MSRRSSTTDAPSADPRIRGKLLNRVEFATCIEFETTYVVPMSTSSALSSRKPADLSRALQVSLQEAVRRLLACSSHSFARSWYLVVPHPPPVLVDEESGNPTSDVRRSYFNHGEIRLHRKTSCHRRLDGSAMAILSLLTLVLDPPESFPLRSDEISIRSLTLTMATAGVGNSSGRGTSVRRTMVQCRLPQILIVMALFAGVSQAYTPPSNPRRQQMTLNYRNPDDSVPPKRVQDLLDRAVLLYAPENSDALADLIFELGQQLAQSQQGLPVKEEMIRTVEQQLQALEGGGSVTTGVSGSRTAGGGAPKDEDLVGAIDKALQEGVSYDQIDSMVAQYWKKEQSTLGARLDAAVQKGYKGDEVNSILSSMNTTESTFPSWAVKTETESPSVETEASEISPPVMPAVEGEPVVTPKPKKDIFSFLSAPARGIEAGKKAFADAKATTEDIIKKSQGMFKTGQSMVQKSQNMISGLRMPTFGKVVPKDVVEVEVTSPVVEEIEVDDQEDEEEVLIPKSAAVVDDIDMDELDEIEAVAEISVEVEDELSVDVQDPLMPRPPSTPPPGPRGRTTPFSSTSQYRMSRTRVTQRAKQQSMQKQLNDGVKKLQHQMKRMSEDFLANVDSVVQTGVSIQQNIAATTTAVVETGQNVWTVSAATVFAIQEVIDVLTEENKRATEAEKRKKKRRNRSQLYFADQYLDGFQEYLEELYYRKEMAISGAMKAVAFKNRVADFGRRASPVVQESLARGAKISKGVWTEVSMAMNKVGRATKRSADHTFKPVVSKDTTPKPGVRARPIQRPPSTDSTEQPQPSTTIESEKKPIVLGPAQMNKSAPQAAGRQSPVVAAQPMEDTATAWKSLADDWASMNRDKEPSPATPDINGAVSVTSAYVQPKPRVPNRPVTRAVPNLAPPTSDPWLQLAAEWTTMNSDRESTPSPSASRLEPIGGSAHPSSVAAASTSSQPTRAVAPIPSGSWGTTEWSDSSTRAVARMDIPQRIERIKAARERNQALIREIDREWSYGEDLPSVDEKPPIALDTSITSGSKTETKSLSSSAEGMGSNALSGDAVRGSASATPQKPSNSWDDLAQEWANRNRSD